MSQEGPKQRKKALKDAQRQVEAELSRQQGDYIPPDRAECVEKEWHQAVDDSATLRISIRLWRHEGRLVDFVFLIETGDWGAPNDWEQLARIDCKGGNCHIHPPDDPEQHQLIHRLDSLDDVEVAYHRANGIATTIATMIRDRRS